MKAILNYDKMPYCLFIGGPFNVDKPFMLCEIMPRCEMKFSKYLNMLVDFNSEIKYIYK